jgi:calcineurin-like phosphoesterase
MKLLFIGDIVGRPGRDLVRVGIGALVAHHGINLVIANGENSAGGNGITREIGDSLIAQGVDVITSGNHVWDKKEVFGADRRRAQRRRAQRDGPRPHGESGRSVPRRRS